MVKLENMHLRISSKYRSYLRQYVNLLRIQGKKITESKVVEEALKQYDIEVKCKKEHAKISGLYKDL